MRFWRRLSSDAGAALVVVMALGMAMLILVTAALTTSVSGLQAANRSEDAAAALAAAYAGVDEYASRLSNDSTYQKYGNPLAPFTVMTGSSATTQLPPAGQENPAFGIGEAGTWAEIIGSDGRAWFRYEVDNSAYTSSGVLRVRSTGRVGDVTRSVIADLKQSGFIDFLYYTDYEIIDPAVLNPSCVVSHAYLSGTTIRHNNNCAEIQFAESDTLDGPVHSNDILKICATVFKGKVTTSSTIPRNPLYNPVSGCSAPTFELGPPEYKLPILPPPTNDQMSLEARADIPDVTRPGCMYTGPTQITFNSNGTMRVVSPWTKWTNPSLTPGIPSENPAACGSISDLQSSTGAVVTVPPQNLIWVQSVPANASDPNYWASNARPSGFSCSNSGRSDEGWSFGSHRYPLANEHIPVTSTAAAPAYGCRNGDAYVKGTLRGQVTVASQNFIYVTGDLVYDDPAIDMLGLVGNNAVWVWNPMERRSSSAAGWVRYSGDGYYYRRLLGDVNRTIHAAILSVNHTFLVQNYDRGNHRGLLHVVGAIAQKFRGPVATTGNTGYDKLYEYHERLYAVSPPKFLTPTSTTYGVTQYAETPPAFDPDGTNR